MCTVLLTPDVNPIAVVKHIISYQSVGGIPRGGGHQLVTYHYRLCVQLPLWRDARVLHAQDSNSGISTFILSENTGTSSAVITNLLFCQWRNSNGWFSSLLWYTRYGWLTTSAFRHGTSNYYDRETELCIISGDDVGDMWKWKSERYIADCCPTYAIM
jgi:hypothetical protein